MSKYLALFSLLIKGQWTAVLCCRAKYSSWCSQAHPWKFLVLYRGLKIFAPSLDNEAETSFLKSQHLLRIKHLLGTAEPLWASDHSIHISCSLFNFSRALWDLVEHHINKRAVWRIRFFSMFHQCDDCRVWVVSFRKLRSLASWSLLFLGRKLPGSLLQFSSSHCQFCLILRRVFTLHPPYWVESRIFSPAFLIFLKWMGIIKVEISWEVNLLCWQ